MKTPRKLIKLDNQYYVFQIDIKFFKFSILWYNNINNKETNNMMKANILTYEI